MRIFFLLLGSIITPATFLFAQKDEPSWKWSVSFTPAIIPMKVMTFGIQPGLEYMLSKRFSLLSEFTFQTGKNNHLDSSTFNKKYFRFKPELRYSFKPKKGVNSSYIGLQATYAFRKFTTTRYGFYYDDLPGDSVYYYDRANINSPITTLTFQFGRIMQIKGNLSVDIFMGFGIKMINSSYSDVINPNPQQRIRAREWFTATRPYQRQGSFKAFQMNTGVRLIYRFPKLVI